MPQRGKVLLNRINYNNGGEVHKYFTTSNASVMLMEGNQPCKMVFETYSPVINLLKFTLITHFQGGGKTQQLLILQENSHGLTCFFDDYFGALKKNTTLSRNAC